MKKRFLSLALAAIMALGLAVPALAAGQTFSDVPSSYWGYADIEAVAEAGLMNGTGGGAFSPEMKVSVAQFLTLLGRLVFPNVKADGADWYGPYVTAAKDAGLLTGTQVDTNNVEAEISRYDMAVILRAAAKKLGVAEKAAQSSEVKDYLDIPTRYADSVLAVYGMGLIRGDQAGNFNGSNTMMRAEVATVIMRLAKAKPGGGSITPGTDPEKPEQPEKPSQPEGPLEPEIVEMPKDEEMATYTFLVGFEKVDHELGAPAYDKTYSLPNVPFKIYYTEDGGKTSVPVAEGTTHSAKDGRVESTEVVFEAPASWGRHYGETGFYVSAETEWEGQRLVTGDLRTDGRAYTNCKNAFPNGRTSFHVELTPPEGLKIHFTFAGRTEAIGRITVPNTTVQLFLKDGTLINETVSGPDGRFEMECEVDILDGVLNLNEKIFQVVAYGELNGISMSQPLTYYGTDEPVLFSLERLGGNSHSLNFPNGSYCVILE